MNVLDVKNSDFLAFLDTMEFDYDWNEEDSFEKGYKQLNYKRYKIEKRDTVVSEQKREEQKEAFQTVNEGAQAVQLSLSSGSKPPEIDIKVEFPSFHMLKTEAVALKSGEVEVARQCRNLKLVVPALLTLETPEGARIKFKTTLGNFL